ncbi:MULTISPECIES: DUF2958 domain-containing protein [unclassified Mesorhizobium]|nr:MULTISPECIES: DUF2958 domain-containing protein [unclassified Mesorhizobium]
MVKVFNPIGEGVWLATELMPMATVSTASPIAAIRRLAAFRPWR